MELAAAYRRAVLGFQARVDTIAADQWSAPTPCPNWNARELVNHVVGEQLWSVPLFDGATIAEVGDRFDGDVLGDDPIREASNAANAAVAAVDAPGALDRTVHLSFGDTPADEYVRQLLADHLIHGWDLATAIGADRTLDPDLVAECAPWFAEREDMYRGGGVIGARVDLPATATDQDRLLAAFGRTP